MAISGLVLTLRDDVDARAFATAIESALAPHAALRAGEPAGRRLPIVAETGSREEDELLVERLASLSAVASVEIAFVEVDEGPIREDEHVANR